MKKFSAILIAMLFSFVFVSGAMADGFLDIEAQTYGGAIDYDLQFIPNGVAGGISGAGGYAQGDADGYVDNGNVGGVIDLTGGGITDTEAYVFNPGIGDLGIGVGSRSFSEAAIGGYGHVYVNTDWNGVFGYADLDMFGIAGQGTLNGSLLGNSPLPMWESDGRTGGIAGQGSIGGFDADAFAGVGWWGSANAGVIADLYMAGGSYSDSYRYIDFNGDYKTEGMGTQVGAYTHIESYDDEWRNSSWSGWSYSDVDGGWIAGGIAASRTQQDAPGFGGARASANGAYFAAGGLDSNYNGSAQGGTWTSVTTRNGMGGSINRAGAEMHVTSSMNSGF